MRRLFLIWLLIFSAAAGGAQTRVIDSLKQLIFRATTDAGRLNGMLALCEEHKSLNRDTLEYYAYAARQLAQKSGDPKKIDLAGLAIANTYNRWGWLDSALVEIQPILDRNPVHDPGTRELHFKVARQKALYYGGKSKYPQALEVLYKLVGDAEQYHDTLTIGANMNTIGSIALQRSAAHTALEWFSRALSFSTHDSRYWPIAAAIYVNMADAYMQLNKMDSAQYFIEKGVDFFTRSQNLYNLAYALQKQSAIYLRLKDFGRAEQALKDMLEVRQRTADAALWVDDRLALIEFYIESNQVQKAIDFCKAALVSGNVYEATEKGTTFANAITMRLGYYEALARCYKIAGQKEQYMETLEQIINAKDSFYTINSAEALAEAQTNYEVQKKENTIIQQKLDLTRKNNLFYLTLGLILFIAVISYLLFIGYRKREQLKTQMMLEKEKDSSLKAVALAEENERKRIAADLHDNLGAFAASIASNLDFIKMEKRTEQEEVAMQELHTNSQAMVSQLGDTIWALNKDALTLTAISDRLKVFIRRIQPSYPRMEMDVQENIKNDLSLPPTQAFHLFRIVQEAFVNAVKHSGASAVHIILESHDQWVITVEDNGKGMSGEMANLTGGGNGLQNMQRRSRVSGWQIEWVANTPSGTKVIISPTTN